MIRLAVLDMAGTTVQDDNAVSGCFCDALEAVGVKPTQMAVTAVMGLPKPEAIRQLLQDANRQATEAEVAVIHHDFVARMIKHYRSSPSVCEIPGATAFFHQLRNHGIKVALNTGFSRDIVDTIVERLGWRDVIDATIASDEVRQGRPHPDMIQALMTRFGLADPQEIAKVGDTAADLQEGQNARCGLNIGITTGALDRLQLEKYDHTHIVDSLSAVADLILS